MLIPSADFRDKNESTAEKNKGVRAWHTMHVPHNSLAISVLPAEDKTPSGTGFLVDFESIFSEPEQVR